MRRKTRSEDWKGGRRNIRERGREREVERERDRGKERE